MAEVDLSFTYYEPDGDAGEDFLITGLSERGELWLIDNTDTTSDAPEGGEYIPVGNAWVKTREQFDMLLAKAKADGLAVDYEAA